MRKLKNYAWLNAETVPEKLTIRNQSIGSNAGRCRTVPGTKREPAAPSRCPVAEPRQRRRNAVLDFPTPARYPLAMLNPKLLDEMSARVSSLLAATPAGDVEKNMRAALGSLFAKLDLVTREEFDVQREVLARAREKLAALEARVAELEARNTTA